MTGRNRPVIFVPGLSLLEGEVLPQHHADICVGVLSDELAVFVDALRYLRRHEMAARGLTQSDSPELLVDFFVTTQERLDVRSTPNHSVHRSHWNRGWYSTWPSYSTTVRQFTEGTLLIDLIDPNLSALVAEGSAQSRIRSNEFTQQQANNVVGQIMAEMLPR